jgi:hypothetical protein
VKNGANGRDQAYNWPDSQSEVTHTLTWSLAIGRIAVIFGCTLVSQAFAANPLFFSQTDISPDAIALQVVALNANGDIAGLYETFDTQEHLHGFLYTSNGTIKTFDAPGAIQTIPQSINGQDVITGIWQAQNGVGPYHAFVWSPTGGIISFDPPGSVSTQSAFINDGGTIAGSFNPPTASGIGYILSNGAYTTFAAPGGSTITSVRGINANGDVAGTVAAPPQPFLRTSNGAFNVISLPLGNSGSIAGLNASDEIAGHTLERISLGRSTYYPVDTCFAWTKKSLTRFESHQLAAASGINDGGDIVGTVEGPQVVGLQSFLRTAGGQITTIAFGGNGTITAASAINNAGVVTGSYFASGVWYGFLLYP